MGPAEERKARTEKLLESLGLPVNPGLPLVESEDETRIRNADDVARRCAVLYARAAVGHDEDRGTTVAWLRDEGLWEHANPNEKAFFEGASPGQLE